MSLSAQKRTVQLTLQMSAPVMVLWFVWMGSGVSITFWLFESTAREREGKTNKSEIQSIIVYTETSPTAKIFHEC